MRFAHRAEDLVPRVALLQEGVCNLVQETPEPDEDEQDEREPDEEGDTEE
jgi:hypothetical protein